MSEAETWTVEHECKLCRFSKAKHTNSDFHSLWIVTKKEAGVQFTMIERKCLKRNDEKRTRYEKSAVQHQRYLRAHNFG